MTPGTAKTTKFQFSTATLCIAPMIEQKAINPLKHSVGLVKNVRTEGTPTKVDLTQGVTNDIVMTVTNGFSITGAGEVYEYTASNLAYGLSQDPTGLVTMAAPVPVGGPVAAAATSVTATIADAAVGDWIYIQENKDDQVHIARLSQVAGSTLTFAGYPVPTGLTFSANARVGKLNKIDADPSRANNNFAIRIIGLAVDGNTPISALPEVPYYQGLLHGLLVRQLRQLALRVDPDGARSD
ncbi:hypothetical protein ACFQWF_01770 [Methylorubrum suomiense]